MNMINEKNIFQTSEFGLSSALISYGFQLECLDKNEPDRVQFVFNKGPHIEKIIEQYWKGSLMVNAIAYFNAFKLLKARLRNEK